LHYEINGYNHDDLEAYSRETDDDFNLIPQKIKIKDLIFSQQCIDTEAKISDEPILVCIYNKKNI